MDGRKYQSTTENPNSLSGPEILGLPLVPAPKSIRILRAEFDTPQPDRLVTDLNTTLGHKVFDVAAAQIEAMVEPVREACPCGTTY